MAKILIIGGGVAGLSAGIYAQKNGHRAIVCERHSVSGGNLTGWQRGEYHIDNCVHWLTGTNPNTELYRTWTELGALSCADDVYQADSLYTCEKDGQRISLYKDLDRLEQEMLKISPQDRKAILALTGAVRSVMRFCGFQGEGNSTLSVWKKARAFPNLLRYFYLSTGELSNRFRHPLLQEFLSCFIGRDFSAFALVFVFATFCGGNGGLPKGGSFAMAQKIAERFIETGGELLLNKEAVKIHMHGERATSVSFADGTNIRADYVLLTVDPQLVFGKILRLEMPKPLAEKYADPKKICFSSYHCAFACESAELPFSGDFIFPLSERLQETLSSRYLILREFTHESSFAPKGQTVLQAMVFCEETRAKEFIALRKNKTEYKRKKETLASAIENAIAEKFPALKGKLRRLDVWTPASYERYTGAVSGTYMSFILPKKSIPRPIKGDIKGAKNVYLATQWQSEPGGLPTAANMGKRAIEWVCQKEAQAAKTNVFSALRIKKRKKA